MSNPATASLPQSVTLGQGDPEALRSDPAPLPLLLSPTRAAHETSLNVRTIYLEIEEGRLPAIRYGRRLMIRREALLAFIEDLEGRKE